MKIAKIDAGKLKAHSMIKPNIGLPNVFKSNTAKITKHRLVTAALALSTLTSCCNMNTSNCDEKCNQTELSCNNDGKDAESVKNNEEKLTEGMVKNRSYAEIEKITGLNKVQYNVLQKLMQEHVRSYEGTKYTDIIGTEYEPDDNEAFSIYIGNQGRFFRKFADTKHKKFTYFSSKFHGPNSYPQCRVIDKPNGAFSVITAYMFGDKDDTPRTYEYNKEGKLIKKNVETKLTEGELVNRSEDEIKKLTGLNSLQFGIVKELMLEQINHCFSNEYGKFYFKNTKYNEGGLMTDSSFKLCFTNGVKEFSFINAGKIGEPDFKDNIMYIDCGLKVVKEKNGDFAIILSGWHNSSSEMTRIYNFTKDGLLKKHNYLPEYMTKIEQEQLKKIEKEEALAKEQEMKAVEARTYSDIKDIDLFKNNDKRTISKFINALNLKNIEYINKKGGHTFFMEGNDCSYKLNITPMEDDPDTYIGVANKATTDGKSEIYVIKAEMFSTNKSDKLILSKMRVVQDGLDENAPTYKKNIKETTKTGGNTSTTTHDVNLNSRKPYDILQIFTNFGDFRKFYEGKISSKTVNDLNEIVTESNSEGKTIKIVSIDKKTGKVTVQGE